MLAETSMNSPKLEAVIMKWKTSLQKQTLINETKSWIFEKINKIYIPLARLTKKERSLKLLKIRNKSTTNFSEINGLVREYYEQSYANKLDNLEEMNKFLEKYNLPRLIEEKTENMSISSNETESIIKQRSETTFWKQGFRSRWLHRWILLSIYQRINTCLSQTIPRKYNEGMFLNSLYKASITLIPNSDKDITKKKKNYTPVSLLNIDAKIKKKILASWIHQYV